MKVAYVRVSTVEQNEARQIEALEKHGIEKWFTEKVSAKDVNRPKLQEMIRFVRKGDTIYVMDQIGDSSDDRDWLEEIAIKEAIADLSGREKRILNLRFFQGKTQMEVAKEIGISQAQVSRLEKSSIEKIKGRI